MFLEPFSAGYWVVPSLTVVRYSGNIAIIQDDVYDQLTTRTGTDPPIASVGGSHFALHSARQVPADLVAVPRSAGFEVHTGDSVLIAKRAR